MTEEPRRPIIPCAAAMSMLGVPAKRWTTKAELLKQLQAAKQHLDTMPLEDLSVGSAAKAAGLSLHHFLRLFKEVHGTTPHRYLTQRRIAAAQELLKSTELSVSEVALEVGFSNPSAFSRLFRAHTGVPPLVYRLRESTRT